MSEDLYQDRYRVNSVRRKDRDYSSWDYFVTICVKDFICCFGEVIDGEMRLNQIWNIVHQEILDTIRIRKNVSIDAFIVMPNHVHMIIRIMDFPKWIGRDALHASPNNKWATCNVALPNDGKNVFWPQKNNLASIVRGLKSSITSKIKKILPEFAWQSSFYEHIIRSNINFQNVRQYIENNPLNRKKDRNNM